MLVPYHTLPNTARVWVYQSDRAFTPTEIETIEAEASEFIESWTRHGDHLKGSFAVKHGQFIILSVDESFANASGCSIDASVRFVKKLEDLLAVDLMNKLNISYKAADTIQIVPLAEFQNLAKNGKITAETVVFNNMVQTKVDVETKWEVPAKESWHARFVG